jgi:hypothetical protein
MPVGEAAACLATFEMGGVVGSLLAGALSDRVGPKLRTPPVNAPGLQHPSPNLPLARLRSSFVVGGGPSASSTVSAFSSH